MFGNHISALILVMVLSVGTNGSSVLPAGHDKLGSTAENVCGDLLEGASGQIQYKHREPYANSENCVWTISVGQFERIKIDIEEFYSTDYTINVDYFRVGYFNKSNYDQENFFTWVFIDYATPQTVEVPGPVAFLQFVTSGSNTGLGFSAKFEAVGDELPSIYNYDNFFLTGEFGVFKYPPNGTYLNNQRTTIVIETPLPNSALGILHYDVEESEGCLVDSVNVYSFYNAAQSWVHYGMICGSNAETVNEFVFSYGENGVRSDPLIITFKSDDSTVGKGFELYWKQY